ncbi:MAG: glycine zipper domain-containing protein [Desulfobacteraceae bacterium]|nr:glycine zipper domain-containing protein [Desulfobacteraceae bacterium]
MSKKYLWLGLVVCPLFLTSCVGEKGQLGAVGGAAGGAALGQAIGHNTQGTLIGAALGTMLGYMVGNEMDKFDQQQLNQAYETGPSHQATSWVNPDNGNRYAVTPQPAYQDNTGRNCRQAEILTTIDGRAEKTMATACRNSNGQWEIQK